ncbi:MAG: LptF/LptG family permease [Cyanophyceae cyanobacterium]
MKSLSLLDRYLATEICLPLCFSVGIFSALGVAVGELADIVNKMFEFNLPLKTAIAILFLKLPEFIAYAFPLSVLLSTLTAYGRLSSDSELVALRSSGMSIYRLVVPALVLSLGVTLVTLFFNELVVPAANYRATTLQAPYIQATTPPPTQDLIYPEYDRDSHLKRLFYAQAFDGTAMNNPIVLHWTEQTLAQIIVADTAKWNPIQKQWDFFNGRTYQLATDASFNQVSPFARRQLSLSKIPLDLAQKYRNPDEMNIAQAQEYIEVLQMSNDNKKLRLFTVRMQQKIAFPFVCLVFSLVGAALGSRRQYASKATSFGICVAVVFSYYFLGFFVSSLGVVGVLSPFLAAWLPNFLGLGIGGWLLVRVSEQ